MGVAACSFLGKKASFSGLLQSDFQFSSEAVVSETCSLKGGLWREALPEE